MQKLLSTKWSWFLISILIGNGLNAVFIENETKIGGIQLIVTPLVPEALMPKSRQTWAIASYNITLNPQGKFVDKTFIGGMITHIGIVNGFGATYISDDLNEFFMHNPGAKIRIVESKKLAGRAEIIVPDKTDKEFYDFLLKKHQEKVKPKIQEAVPQLPAGVTKMASEYCDVD